MIGASLLESLFEKLEQAAPAAALRESTLAYPIVNALHIIGIALLFGAIVTLDLRLIGWRRQAGSVDQLASRSLPVAITGLALAVPAGMLLFATDARAYAASPLFQAKMIVIALAIVNALSLRAIDWRRGRSGPRLAFAGAASILLWSTAIVLGRLVGYF